MWAADLNLKSPDLDHLDLAAGCPLFFFEGDDEQRMRQGGLLTGSH